MLGRSHRLVLAAITCLAVSASVVGNAAASPDSGGINRLLMVAALKAQLANDDALAGAQKETTPKESPKPKPEPKPTR